MAGGEERLGTDSMYRGHDPRSRAVRISALTSISDRSSATELHRKGPSVSQHDDLTHCQASALNLSCLWPVRSGLTFRLQPGPPGDDGGAFRAAARQAATSATLSKIVDEGAEAVYRKCVPCVWPTATPGPPPPASRAGGGPPRGRKRSGARRWRMCHSTYQASIQEHMIRRRRALAAEGALHRWRGSCRPRRRRRGRCPQDWCG